MQPQIKVETLLSLLLLIKKKKISRRNRLIICQYYCAMYYYFVGTRVQFYETMLNLILRKYYAVTFVQNARFSALCSGFLRFSSPLGFPLCFVTTTIIQTINFVPIPFPRTDGTSPCLKSKLDLNNVIRTEYILFYLYTHAYTSVCIIFRKTLQIKYHGGRGFTR